MIENFIPQDFVPAHAICSDPQDSDFILYVTDNKLLFLENNHLPQWQDLKAFLSVPPELYYFGSIKKQRYLLVDSVEPTLMTPPGFITRTLRQSYGSLDDATFRVAGLGVQLHYWRSTHRYCGACGTKNLDKTEERAKICPQCHYVSYPQLYPCIIVLVTRGRDLLLARSPHFSPGVYSTLAGFIEPGESTENAVLREVKEETNITVKNIRYLISQPWPFPNSLMLGFTAEYESGEIKIDNHEIEDADWFDPERLPTLPSPLSISRWLIEQHLNLS